MEWVIGGLVILGLVVLWRGPSNSSSAGADFADSARADQIAKHGPRSNTKF